jgi:hypothetical protein
MSSKEDSDILRAPWTPEQVVGLTRYQTSGLGHPYTCGSGRRTDAAHRDGEGVLRATEAGWECPYCDYRQDYAYVFTMISDAAWEQYQSWFKGVMDANGFQVV